MTTTFTELRRAWALLATTRDMLEELPRNQLEELDLTISHLAEKLGLATPEATRAIGEFETQLAQTVAGVDLYCPSTVAIRKAARGALDLAISNLQAEAGVQP
jgi:hypothetical protein